MLWAFLSARFRRWLIMALVVPLGGRVLERLGMRMGDRNPRVGDAVVRTGRRMRRPARRSRYYP